MEKIFIWKKIYIANIKFVFICNYIYLFYFQEGNSSSDQIQLNSKASLYKIYIFDYNT